jgi:hypothetical protein
MADPVYITCSVDPCNVAVTLNVELIPFAMTNADAGAIAGAVLAVLAVGWAFRVLIRMLRDSDGNQPSEEN